MKRGATWRDKVDRILNSMSRECQRVHLEIDEIDDIPPAEADEVLKKAKMISHRLRVFERRIRVEIGLAMTNPTRRRGASRE